MIQVKAQPLVPEKNTWTLVRNTGDQVRHVAGQKFPATEEWSQETVIPDKFRESALFHGQEKTFQLLRTQTQALRLNVQQETVGGYAILLRAGSPEVE